MYLNLTVIFLFFNLLISISLLKRIWQYRHTPGATHLMGLSGAVAVWSLGFAFELLTSDLSLKFLWVKFQYIGISLIAPTWFVFSISYTRTKFLNLNKKSRLLYPYLLPFLTLLVVWTNDWHGWFFAQTEVIDIYGIPLLENQHGFWFWIHIIYSYAMILLGSYIFTLNQIKSLKYYQDQAIVVLLAISLPLITNILHVTKIIPGLDLTIFAFNISGVLFFWVLYSRQFLKFLPVAYQEVMDSNQNGLIILDSQKRIISMNRIARLLANNEKMENLAIGMNLSELPGTLKKCLEPLFKNGTQKSECNFVVNEEIKVFEVSKTELSLDNSQFWGWILTLHDISQQKEVEKNLLKMQLELEERVLNRTKDIQRLSEQRKRLIEVSLNMVSTLSFEQVVRTIMHSLQDVLDFSVCIIYWLDHDKKFLQSTEVVTTDPDILRLVPEKIPVDKGIAGYVASSGAAILANQAIQDARSFYISENLKPLDEHLVSVPLVYKGEVVGVFQVSRLNNTPFTQDEFELIQLFASLANVAIQNSKLFSELEQFSADIHNQKDQMRLLAKHIEQVREMEQLQLAQELHDRMGQNLTALVFNLNIIDQVMPPGAPDLVHERLSDSKEIVKQSVQQVRDLLTDLRPPMLDEKGVLSAIKWYAENYSRRAQFSVEIIGHEIRPRLDPKIETAFFRIAQEALTNAAKHAKAKHVKIHLQRENKRICLEVEDDGIGFDLNQAYNSTESEHWGLITMQERAFAIGGDLVIDSMPGTGTRVSVTLPSQFDMN